MGIFDFGDKPTTTTSSTAPQYAEELKPYLKEITEARKKLYEQRLGEGYQYYPGQTIAGLTSEEVAAQQGIKGLMGSQAPLQQEALNLQRGTARDFTPEEAQKYMSPYLRSSLDAQKAESQRQYERTAVPQFEAQAVAAGGMSGLGSRAGVEAAERATGQNRLLASIEAEGQQKAYEASQAAFRDQTARERQASAGIGKLSGDIFRGGTQELGLLQSIGEQKRDMSQSALDEAYLRYMQQQQYPEQQLNRYQSAIYGNPLNQQPSYTKTGTEAGGGPELGKTILGIGSTLAGLWGASDERMKTDKTKLGKDPKTGLDMYAFRYKDDPKNYPKVVGPMAQDVEKQYPDSVKTLAGTKVIKDMPLFNTMQGGGLASVMQQQGYVNRNMGGPVMPPVMYRENGGGINATDIPTRPDERNIEYSSEAQIRKAMEIPYRDFKKQSDAIPYLPDAEAPQYSDKERFQLFGPARDMPLLEYQQRALDEKRARGLTATELSDDTLGTGFELRPEENKDLVKLKNAPEAKSKTVKKEVAGAKKQIESVFEIKLNKMFDDIRAAESDTTKIKGINKASEEFRVKNQKRFDKYQDLATKLTGEDPLAQQKFWFTVSAAILKPGNAFANMAQGLKEATLAASGDREKKNKLLMELSKDEMEFGNDMGKFKLKAEIQTLGLTDAQNKKIARLPLEKQKILLEQLKALTANKLAQAKLINSQTKAKKEGQLKVSEIDTIFNQQFKNISSKGIKMTEFGPVINGAVYGPKASEHQAKLMKIYTLAMRMRDKNEDAGDIAAVIERGIASLSKNK
jgi:hypothetical protein